MIRLYSHPKSRGIRPLILLEELGVPYELVPVDMPAKEHKSPEYRKIHPLGQLPALVDGDRTLIESVAICLYLADKHLDRGLAPPVDSPERGPYYQWCVYTVGTLEAGLITAYRARHGVEPDPDAEGAMRDALGVLADALGDRQTLLAGGFSTADVLIGSSLVWMRSFGVALPGPLDAYADRLLRRPSFRKVFEAQSP